jgi:hypothetical protein
MAIKRAKASKLTRDILNRRIRDSQGGVYENAIITKFNPLSNRLVLPVNSEGQTPFVIIDLKANRYLLPLAYATQLGWSCRYRLH